MKGKIKTKWHNDRHMPRWVEVNLHLADGRIIRMLNVDPRKDAYGTYYGSDENSGHYWATMREVKRAGWLRAVEQNLGTAEEIDF